MSDLITKAKLAIWLRWLVVGYLIMFSIASLCTSIQIAMANGAEWGTLTTTQRFLIVVGIFGNWCNTMLAFFHKGIGQVQDIDKSLPDDAKTVISTVTDTHTEALTTKPEPAKPAVDNSGQPVLVLPQSGQEAPKPKDNP